MKTPVRVMVILLSLGLLGAGIYGTTQISEKFDLRLLGEDGSFYIHYLDKQEEFIDKTEAVHVVTTDDIDYSQEAVQQSLLLIATMMDDDPLYLKRANSWITTFRTWANETSRNTTGPYFIPSLFTFISDPVNQRYYKDLSFAKTRDRLLASRVTLFLRDGLDSIQEKDGMENVRERADSLLPFKSYPISYIFVYFEQFAIMREQTLFSLAICCVVITVITSLYVIHPGIVAVLLLSFVGLTVELFGLMAAWGVNLNSISMVCLVMAIGFAADYSAHVAHYFAISSKDTPEERIIHAFETIGHSVFLGGLSTLIGVSLLALSSSEIFRVFFKMFFGIVALGLINGLVINPVYLSVLCRSRLAMDLDSYDIKNPKQDIEMPEKDNKVNFYGEQSPIEVAS